MPLQYLKCCGVWPRHYGVQAASQHYFGVPAERLTRYQAAQLAVVLPNPYKIQPVPMSNYVQRRVHWVLGQMRNLGEVSL